MPFFLLLLIESDRKDYHCRNMFFAVSQVEENDLELLDRRHQEIVCSMQEKLENQKLDFIALMVTDAVRGHSKLLFCGDKRVSALLPYDRNSDGIFFMPGVVSRKKQLLPQLTAMISTVSGE